MVHVKDSLSIHCGSLIVLLTSLTVLLALILY